MQLVVCLISFAELYFQRAKFQELSVQFLIDFQKEFFRMSYYMSCRIFIYVYIQLPFVE